MICAKPIYVFRELIHYLADQRMVAPGYSIMQDTVGRWNLAEGAAKLSAHKKFPLGEFKLIPKAFVERLRCWHGRLNLQRESGLFQ